MSGCQSFLSWQSRGPLFMHADWTDLHVLIYEDVLSTQQMEWGRQIIVLFLCCRTLDHSSTVALMTA